MASTLVINPGSTSKKYALFNGDVLIYSMFFEKTGDGFGVCREKNGVQQKCESIEAHVYAKALEHFVSEAIADKVIEHANDIDAVGVRIVAPGTPFTKHAQLTDTYLTELEKTKDVAPLHTPSILEEIYAAKALVPHAVAYGISDSAFHASMPSYRRRIGLPQKDTDAYDINRFGYHGLSMSSLVRRGGSFFGVAPDRLIVCHIGGGISVTAIHYEESVDTSMGYSPSSGVMMGSRVGMFDADALVALMTKKDIRDIEKMPEYLNKESGFKGLTGFSDLRLVLNQFTEGDEAALEAMQMFRYQLQRQIGGHYAVLGGLDAVILTGTAAVRNPFLRRYLLEGLGSLGILLDEERNESLIGKEGMIHSDRSDVSVAVMNNDEMGEIARQVSQLRSKA